MKRLTLAVILSLTSGAMVSLPVMARQDSYTTQTQAESYTDAELDSLLAPIALYPDTILTHILIASTYPLEVIAADRWRQQHDYLDAEEVEREIEDFDWDPSVKAIVPFTEILQTLSGDLNWLQALGDNVLISQGRVLARVQVLRQHALNAGTLGDNEYQRIERDRDTIVIAPVRKEIVYVPYYDTRVVYGSWWHPVAPVYWHHPSHYRFTAGFYWSPSIRLSTHFYFGGISWHDRHVVVTRRPVKRFYYGNDIKRSYSRDYQPWQHNANHRRVRYSDSVVRYSDSVARTPGKRYVNQAHKVKRRVDYSPVSNHHSAASRGGLSSKPQHDNRAEKKSYVRTPGNKNDMADNRQDRPLPVKRPDVIKRDKQEKLQRNGGNQERRVTTPEQSQREYARSAEMKREVYKPRQDVVKNGYQSKPTMQRNSPTAQRQNVRNYPQRTQNPPRDTGRREKDSRMHD